MLFKASRTLVRTLLCIHTTRLDKMVDYKRFSNVAGDTALFDSADLTMIAKNISPIAGVTRMIKQSKAHTIAIGEGSHGTKEFYSIRCEITKQLIVEQRCNCVLIEGDWPDVAELHRFVTGMSPELTVDDALAGLKRFPRWMWRNETMKQFLQWLFEHNNKLPATQRCGIFGLDIYSLHRSMEAVLEYLEAHDPDCVAAVRRDYSCFDKFGTDAQTYGRLVELGVAQGCRNAAVRALSLVAEHAGECLKGASLSEVFRADEALIAVTNAEVVVGAEKYCTSMFNAEENSWNIRDTHFFHVFNKVRDHFLSTRSSANMVVWAHNSHLGDARYTHLDASRFTSGQELNLGQLLKERYGCDCLLVGQLTYSGKVMASDDWDGRGQIKGVRKALSGSYEEFFHACAQKAAVPDFTLDLRQHEVAKVLANNGIKLERAIGVIYRPQTERLSHYYFCDIGHQFDLLCFSDVTSAVEAMDGEEVPSADSTEPETFPSGY